MVGNNQLCLTHTFQNSAFTGLFFQNSRQTSLPAISAFAVSRIYPKWASNPYAQEPKKLLWVWSCDVFVKFQNCLVGSHCFLQTQPADQNVESHQLLMVHTPIYPGNAAP